MISSFPFPSKVHSRVSTLSLRKRVSLFAALGVGIVALLISMAAYGTVRVAMLHQVDQNLLDRAHAVVSSGLGPSVLAQVPPEALGAADVQVGFLRADNKLFAVEGARSPLRAGQPELSVARGFRAETVRTIIGRDQQEYRIVAVPADNNYALILAQPTAATEQLLGLLGFVLALFGIAGMALAAWAGFGIARTGLRPVERLTGAAEHVARTGDLRPIPVHGDDELARLAHAFNAMLAALSRARVRERRLVADAGHELRTPLTSLRTNLDLLVQSEGQAGLSAEDRTALLDDVRGQVTELSALVGDLVELSRDDPPSAAQVQLDLAELTTHAVERVRRRAPRVEFDVQLGSWPMIGDPQGLERAVTNLLDNAAKWSPAHGVVTVRLQGGVLTIADQGPGLADADLPHVFERFYRSAEGRTMPGSGLGLAIVKQAVDRHGGTVHAARAPEGGGLFTVRLPHATTQPAPPTP